MNHSCYKGRRQKDKKEKNDEVTGRAQVVRRVESPQKIN